MKVGCVKHAPPGKPFLLKSGLTSNIYVDLRTLSHHPRLFAAVAQQLWEISKDIQGVDYVAGLPLGGIPMATLISQLADISLLLIRKEAKEHGTGKVVEADINTEKTVLLIDDVMTTGSTVRETIARFTETGVPLKPAAVVCIVSRCEGNVTTVPGTDIPFRYLFTLDDLRSQPQRQSFAARAQLSKNATASRLFDIMHTRQSNVCFSADVEQGSQLIELFSKVAPHIAAIKIHFDAVQNLDVLAVFEIARKHNVFVLGDRKFADIGSTVAKQLKCHPAGGFVHSGLAMDACTVHPVAGPSALDVLAAANIGAVLVGQMSNAGSSADSESARRMAIANNGKCMGFVCQDRAVCEAGDGFVYFTPGVHLEATSDGADQRYRGCKQAIAEQNNDVVIVGRGILAAADPEATALEYKKQAWDALGF